MIFRGENGLVKEIKRNVYFNNTEYFEAISYFLTNKNITTKTNMIEKINKLISCEYSNDC